MTEASLSIVIPTLNEASVIARALTQLQPLRETGAEVILADGGSTDNTLSLAESMVDKVVGASKGRATQMNAGAKHARGSWVLFLHADTQLPNDISQWWRSTQTNPSRWGFFLLRLDGKHWLFRCIEFAINRRSRLTQVATGDQCLFIQKQCFEQMGGFKDIPLMEDVAFSKTLRRLCKPIVWRSPVTTSSRRWEQRGILKTVLLMWRLRLAYFLGASPHRLSKIYYG
jgi:rSAM/selenodomain-associated transferase 2